MVRDEGKKKMEEKDNGWNMHKEGIKRRKEYERNDRWKRGSRKKGKRGTRNTGVEGRMIRKKNDSEGGSEEENEVSGTL